MNLEHINSLYSLLKIPALIGRYINNAQIEKCLQKYPKSLISVLGYSVEKRPIYSLKFGKGPIKILLWSQMHGNESTTTKALFDCFNLFETNNELPKHILNTCTLVVIPILNPDGAERYTRLNANNVDLNRDAQDLSQPESRVLRDVFNSFMPHYCFNLHGQRTIFDTANSGVSATLSFLSPSQDEGRSLTSNRKTAMTVISEISKLLKTEIPNGIGRYDDGFNLNCVGDTFQNFGVPTLLYEAGHYPNDYSREEVRRLTFIAIIKGLHVISNKINASMYEDYFSIPENSKCFYDIIVRNARISSSNDKLVDIAVQYSEVLKGDKVVFVPIVRAISKLDEFYGHKEIDAKGGLVKSENSMTLKIDNENDFVFIENEKMSLKL